MELAGPGDLLGAITLKRPSLTLVPLVQAL
jgi:hypothetical protein